MTRKIVIHHCGDCSHIDNRFFKAFCKKERKKIVEYKNCDTTEMKDSIKNYAIPGWCKLEEDE